MQKNDFSNLIQQKKNAFTKEIRKANLFNFSFFKIILLFFNKRGFI